MAAGWHQLTNAADNDTAAAIHCPRQWITELAICSKQTYHRPNQPHYSLYPVTPYPHI